LPDHPLQGAVGARAQEAFQPSKGGPCISVSKALSPALALQLSLCPLV